jgi:RimJ/RimL family protein N-acetyltransferase
MNYLLTNQETKRLKFRLLHEDDFDRWLPLFKYENIAKYLDFDPKLSPNEMCEKWFEKSLNRYDLGNGGMNVMINNKTNRFIGQCGLLIQNIDSEERLEIGYSILPEFWNCGYASEAAALCKDYAFENNFSESLISMTHIENIGSEKVALKNGMTLEKTIGDFNIFSIDKKDWG